MKNNTITTTKTEKKELLIFLSVAFGIPFLMGIPHAMAAGMGKEVYSLFAGAQMLYPAAGFMLARLLYGKGKGPVPKPLFLGFLVLTAAEFFWCFSVFFLPEETVTLGGTLIGTGGSLALFFLLFLADDETREANGLGFQNWKLILKLTLLFIALYFTRIFVLLIFTGDLVAVTDGFQPSRLLNMFGMFVPGFLFSVSVLLGEEYGWRCYFQPLFQAKFGLIKGVFLFGTVWAFWHLPLDFVSVLQPAAYIEDIVQTLMIRYAHCILLAIFFAYAYMRTRSVWAPMLVHFANNYFAGLGGEALSQAYDWTMSVSFILVEVIVFLPFIFTKVFRKKAETERVAME